jgi:hypothetical protein
MPTYSGNLVGQTGTDGTTATGVAANYLRMPAQDQYATGAEYSNFGTRSLRLLKVVTSGGTNDLTKGADGANGSYKDTNSVFGRCVRALQTMGEVYLVGQPDATTFLVLVSADTVNDASVGSNTANTTYNAMETVIAASMNASGAATVTATGTAANQGIFVGGALGTFA